MPDQTDPRLNPKGNMPYIGTAVIMALILVILIGAVLYLRPAYDPLVTIGGCATAVLTFTGSILALMKAQETHVLVNGASHALNEATAKIAHLEGMMEGITKERERVASINSAPSVLPLSMAGPVDVVVKQEK